MPLDRRAVLNACTSAGAASPLRMAEAEAFYFTGHPALILPNGLRGSDASPAPAIDDGNHDNIGGSATPVSLTFLAGHYQDAGLAAFTNTYQEATGFQHLHPPTGPIDPSRGL